jgi:tRNA (cmo5U34)-methyltransferase
MAEASAPEVWSLSDTEMFARYGDVCVPRRAEQAAIVCDLLADIPVRRVLDLCCGEGRLSEEFLRRHDDGRVVLLDGSAEMLSLAAARLVPFGARHTMIQADIAETGWRSPSVAGAGTRLGGVMTSLAVHHLDGPGKQRLYRDLHQLLEPGGAFVMADLVEPASPVARALAADQWDQAVRETSLELFGSDEAEQAFVRTEWNYYRQPGPDSFDMPSSVAEHADWLREAGFTQVDVAWMFAGHAIFTARRRGAAPPAARASVRGG